MPKSYPPEFKARVLALLKAGRSIQLVALELELSEATIYTWRKQDEIDSGARPGLSSPKRPNSRPPVAGSEEEVLILNNAGERWKPVVPPKDRFALIGEPASQGVSIERASRLLDVSAAGYFAWRSRPPSERAIRHAWLTDVIRQVHADSFQTLRARRVYAELTLGRGLVVGRGAVESQLRLLQRAIRLRQLPFFSPTATPGEQQRPSEVRKGIAERIRKPSS